MTKTRPLALFLLDIENVPGNAHTLASIGVPDLPPELALDVYIAGSAGRIPDHDATKDRFIADLATVDPRREVVAIKSEHSPNVKNGADMLIAAQIPLALSRPAPPNLIILASNDKALIEVCASLAGVRFLNLHRPVEKKTEDQSDLSSDAEEGQTASPYADLQTAISEHASLVLDAITGMSPGDQLSFQSATFGYRIDGILSNSHRAVLAQKFAPYVDSGGEISIKPQFSNFGPAISLLKVIASDWKVRPASDPASTSIGITILLGMGRDAHAECRRLNGVTTWHVRLVKPKLTAHVPQRPKVENLNLRQIPTAGLTMDALASLMTEKLEAFAAGGRARYTPDVDATHIGMTSLTETEIEYLDHMAKTYISSGTLPSIVGQKHYGEMAKKLQELMPQLAREPGSTKRVEPSVIGGCISALWLSIGYTLLIGTHRQSGAIRFQITIESGPCQRAATAADAANPAPGRSGSGAP